MGVNISLYRGDYEEHPAWDFYRHSGDREIFRILDRVGYERKPIGHPYDCEFYYRPKSVEAFVAAMVDEFPENADRWQALGAILADPEWWINYGI